LKEQRNPHCIEVKDHNNAPPKVAAPILNMECTISGC
jgi:hypothetical protein